VPGPSGSEIANRGRAAYPHWRAILGMCDRNGCSPGSGANTGHGHPGRGLPRGRARRRACRRILESGSGARRRRPSTRRYGARLRSRVRSVRTRERHPRGAAPGFPVGAGKHPKSQMVCAIEGQPEVLSPAGSRACPLHSPAKVIPKWRISTKGRSRSENASTNRSERRAQRTSFADDEADRAGVPAATSSATYVRRRGPCRHRPPDYPRRSSP